MRQISFRLVVAIAAVAGRLASPACSCARRRDRSAETAPQRLSLLRGGGSVHSPFRLKASRSASVIEGVDLSFSDLSFTVKDGMKTILSNCSGHATRGRMLAIMGPSGGGKTTLLNALSGNVKASKGASLTGTLLCNGEKCGGASQVSGLRMAFVQQEDTFYTQMTVRETLLFAARLRLPSSVSLEEKERRVDDIIAKLSLVKAAGTIIGDVKRRGISGGERKRLAIGCELLSDPQLLFLDEPTSGLDSFQAQQVVQSLKALADEGCTVVMSIHQPRGSIYNLFDDLLLLSEGRVIYNGAAAGAAAYFGNLGHPCPAGINAGEFVVDLVSVPYGSKVEEGEAHRRILELASAAAADGGFRIGRGASARDGVASTGEAASGDAQWRQSGQVQAGSHWTQFRLLFRRAWKEVSRSRVAIMIKASQQLMIALIYGGIYSLGRTQSSIQDRFGLLSLVAIGAGNLAIASTIRTFPKEKAIVASERSKGMYSVAPYFLSKVLADYFPLIASACF